MVDEPSQIADEALVRQALAGKRAAYDALAARYRTAIVAMAFLRTGDHDAADDLAQEVLARAWEKLPTLQEPRAFVAWLRAIMTNACRGWFRKAPWPASLLDLETVAEMPAPSPTPVELVLQREQQRALQAALAAIPEKNRLALLLHVWGDYSYETIATFLDVPLTTVEGRIYRAKCHLRQTLRTADDLSEGRW